MNPIKDENTVTQRIWLTWEEHRRSRELAEKFDSTYMPLLTNLPNPMRYAWLILRTLFCVAKHHPTVIFCQNPSIVLTALICATRFMHRAIVVVDRHTNFYFEHHLSRELKWRLHNFLGWWTDRHADLVIVTNAYLAEYVTNEGGVSVVLPDPLPNLTPSTRQINKAKPIEVLFVGSGGHDEPLKEVLAAAQELVKKIHLTITSSGSKRLGSTLSSPANVSYPGYLPYDEYVARLCASDIIVVLTTMEHTLCCGAYEAISALRPMVLSATPTIENYFTQGAVYTNPDAHSIAKAITKAIDNWEQLRREVEISRTQLPENWSAQFNAACDAIARAQLKSKAMTT